MVDLVGLLPIMRRHFAWGVVAMRKAQGARKGAWVLVVLACAAASPWPQAPVWAQTPAVSEDAGMRRVQLLLRKLRESMQSLKDLDALERAGMPKRDVDRMRRALKAKIQEMIDETVASIREL